MASKDKTTSPTSQTTTSVTEETIVPLPSDGGLADIAASATSKAGKRTGRSYRSSNGEGLTHS